MLELLLEGRQRLEVEFAASGHEGHFRLRQGRTSLERAQPQRRPDETEVLSRELGRLGRDDVYEGALRAAARLEAVLPGR